MNTPSHARSAASIIQGIADFTDVKMNFARATDVSITIHGCGKQMKTIKVRCAICGFTAVIELKWDHRKGLGSEPGVWICDTHR